MQDRRDTDWQIVSKENPQIQDAWNTLEVFRQDDRVSVIAKVAKDARVPLDADMRLLVDGKFRDIHSPTCPLPGGGVEDPDRSFIRWDIFLYRAPRTGHLLHRRCIASSQHAGLKVLNLSTALSQQAHHHQIRA